MGSFSRMTRRPLALFMVMAMVLSMISGMTVKSPDKVVAAGNIFSDAEFADVDADGSGAAWQYYLSANDGGWAGENVTVTGDGAGTLDLDFAAVGGGFADAKWGVQIYQTGVTLSANTEYTFSFDLTSTGTKSIEAKFDGYESLLDEVVQAAAGTNHYSFTIPVSETDITAKFLFAAGWFSGDDSAVDVKISNVKMEPVVKVESVLLDTQFADVDADGSGTTWQYYLSANDGGWAGENVTITGDGAGTLDLDFAAVGGGFADAKWGVQIYQTGVTLSANTEYTFSFDLTSTGTKSIEAKFDGYESLLDEVVQAAAGTNHYSFTIPASETDITAKFLFAAGWFSGDDSAVDIKISNLSMVPTSLPVEPEEPDAVEVSLAANNKDVTFQRAYNEELPNAPIAQFRVYDSLEEAGADTGLDGFAGYPMTLNADGIWETSATLAEALAEGQVIKYFFVEFDANGAGYNSDFGYYSLFVAADYEAAKSVENMENNGWKLVWNDEFDGDSLDTTKWSYQIGNGLTESSNPGWGNQELEYYTNSTDNVSVSDGKLTITAKKETTVDPAEGTFNYTSGRIRTVSNTENLFSVKYGRIEAYMSLPMENGCWPAFWMLPDNQDIYGGWAASGEIDIMEGWGNRPYEACGTVHYGGNWPNNLYKGKTYTFDSTKTNVGAYHLYALEWEPGKLSWYYDDELLYSTDTWNSIGKNAGEDFTFGAPYDVPFYIMFNLAVGGTFGAGDPASGDFSGNGNTSMSVDYVRVYQLEEGYDESGVTAGGSSGDSDAYDKYVAPLLEAAGLDSYEGYNFAGDTSYSTLNTVSAVDPDDTSWQFYVGPDFGGAATVSAIDKDGTKYAAADITSAGSYAYAIQLIKHMPMISGYTYKVSFDAYADSSRDVTIHPSGDSDNGWAGYASETITVGTEPENYSFYFTMGNDSDPTARLEFNLGAAGTSNIYIGNVVVEMVSKEAVEEDSNKTVLADGNIIWNGTFDQGTDRLGYWNINDADAEVPSYVLYELGKGDIFSYDKGEKQNYARRAEITATGDNASISQDGLTLKQSDQYSLKFDVYSEDKTDITVTVSNADGSLVYSSEVLKYSAAKEIETLESIFAMPKGITDEKAVVTIGFENGAELLLDNVELRAITNNNSEIDYSKVNTTPIPEDSDGWYTNYYTAANVSAVPDEDGVYTVDTWKDTNNYQSMFLHELDIVEGVTYKFSFEAKSDVENTYIVGIQEDNTWAMAWDTVDFDTTPEWKTYEYEFKSGLTTGGNTVYMKYLLSACDNESKLYLRNLKLEAAVASAAEDPEEGSAVLASPSVEVGENVIINLNDSDWAGAFAANSLNNGKAVIMINETPLDPAELVDIVEEGKITLPASYFGKAGNYKIELALDGYNNYVLNAVVTEPVPPTTEEPPVSTEEPPVSTEEPPVSTEEPPVSIEETTQAPSADTTAEAQTTAASGNVGTGDNANIIVWLILAVLAAGVITGVVVKRKED